MDILGASSGGTDRSNAIGDSGFTKFNSTVSRTQPLPEKFSVLDAATGQYSFQPLLADEQFSLGGPDWARAWDPAELLGDSGWDGKVELRYTEPARPALSRLIQPYGYYDIGKVYIYTRRPAPTATRRCLRRVRVSALTTPRISRAIS